MNRFFIIPALLMEWDITLGARLQPPDLPLNESASSSGRSKVKGEKP